MIYTDRLTLSLSHLFITNQKKGGERLCGVKNNPLNKKFNNIYRGEVLSMEGGEMATIQKVRQGGRIKSLQSLVPNNDWCRNGHHSNSSEHSSGSHAS